MSVKEFTRSHVIQQCIEGSLTVHQSALRLGLSERIISLYQDPALQNTNFTHFRVILEKRYGIKISYPALYRLLTKANFKSPKKRRKRKQLHPLRTRRSAFGAMLQADGTPYAWFGGKQRYCLHGFIDDATGQITGLWMTKNECLLGYLEVLRQTLTQFGIPQSLYSDRYSVFFYNPKKEGLPSIADRPRSHLLRHPDT